MDTIAITTTNQTVGNTAPHQIFVSETPYINTITTTGYDPTTKEEEKPDALDEELNIYFGLTKTEPEHNKVIAHVTGATLQNPEDRTFEGKRDNLPQNFGEASEQYANEWDEIYKTLNKDWKDFRRTRVEGRQRHTIPTIDEALVLQLEQKGMGTALFIEQNAKIYETVEVGNELRLKLKNASSPKYTVWNALKWATVLGICATVLYQIFV